MKKNTFFTALILILTLILGACGQSATNDNDNSNNNSNADGQIEDNGSQSDNEVNEDDENDAENEDADDNETSDGENEGSNETGDSEEDETDSDNNGAGEDDQAMERTNSDEQNYSIEVLPNYTLTSEEPGKDSLYLTDDGTVFMRVETEQASAETYDYFKENLVSLLEATSENGAEPTELSAAELPTGEQLEDVVGYQVNTVEGVTTGYVFNSDGLTVRITVFDTLEETHLQEFIQMAQTIQSK